MQVEEKKCVVIKKTYHFNIKIDDDNYFYIVQTLDISGEENIMSYKRGNTFWDCQKRLKTAQKKKIKRMIDLMF